MPSTWPVSVSADLVMVKPSPSLSSVTLASVSSVPWLMARTRQREAQRHREAAGMRGGDQFFRVGAGPSSNRVLKP